MAPVADDGQFCELRILSPLDIASSYASGFEKSEFHQNYLVPARSALIRTGTSFFSSATLTILKLNVVRYAKM